MNFAKKVELKYLSKKMSRTPLKKSAHIPFTTNLQQVATDWQIYVIPDRCKGCKLCIAFCPRNILEEDQVALNVKGYHPPRLVSGETTEHCAGCEFCQLICPEFAIFIKQTEEPKK